MVPRSTELWRAHGTGSFYAENYSNASLSSTITPRLDAAAADRRRQPFRALPTGRDRMARRASPEPSARRAWLPVDAAAAVSGSGDALACASS